ncbi:uncharacterized protein LOC127845402 [Dreissena polymorpha]|nr:uncharacterized protein LOC127845402 [Dreissena polymorpha]XP_052232250.1 uncharacterized protein LOC127845402 [Dreissena polymorpha]
MAGSECLFHDDRTLFGEVQRDLQKAKWLPRKHAHRLGMAVCSCRKRKGQLPSAEVVAEIKTQGTDVLNLLAEDKSKFLPSTYSFLVDCINTARENNFSKFKLLTVLVHAKENDFSLISREALCVNHPVSERDIQKEQNRNKKLTAHQIEIIRAKKAKKMKKDFQPVLVNMPIFPRNFKRLEDDLGEKFFQFVSKHKVYVEFDNAFNDSSIAENRESMHVNLYGPPETVKMLSRKLVQSAGIAQQAMNDSHEERRARKLVRQYQKAVADDAQQWSNDILDHVKERMEDDFALKVWKSSKDSHGKSKRSTVKAPTSVLDGGKCLQCQKPFSSLKDKTTCKYHAGYMTYDGSRGCHFWSCCDMATSMDDSMFDNHHTTGCCESVAHNWRTHAKANGKDKDDITLPKFYKCM